MLKDFPLQTKLRRLVATPWLSIGFAEVMNCNPRLSNSSFLYQNNHNLPFPGTKNGLTSTRLQASKPVVAGASLGGGLFDSYDGANCSSAVAHFLQRVLENHRVDPGAQRQWLRGLAPTDPLRSSAETLLALRPHHVAEGQSTSLISPYCSVLSPQDMQHYARSADSAFFDACRQLEDSDGKSTTMRFEGCRGVWFNATLGVADDCKPCVDVCVANLGDSRAFGICISPNTKGAASAFDPTRSRIAGLSKDHTLRREDDFSRISVAGSKVVPTPHGECIDGIPNMNVARAFGHWHMKCDPNRAPSLQKLVADASSTVHRFYAGDVIVLTNLAVYHTRSGELATVDDVASVALTALNAGASPDEAAAALCDNAVTYGARHTLQAMVVTVPSTIDGAFSLETHAITPRVTHCVDPGPIHPTLACASSKFCDALYVDAQRCGLSMSEFLELRWRVLEPLYKNRPQLDGLMAAYKKDCNGLTHLLRDELQFFEDGPGGRSPTEYFASLERKLARSSACR